MSTPYTKTGLARFTKIDPDKKGLNPHYRRSILYYRQLFKAWPNWCANDPAIKAIYKEAERRRKNGEDVHVDHIVPITSNLVSGLHVAWNLQIIHTKYNYAKSNYQWPDHPYENHDLFDTLLREYKLKSGFRDYEVFN